MVVVVLVVSIVAMVMVVLVVSFVVGIVVMIGRKGGGGPRGAGVPWSFAVPGVTNEYRARVRGRQGPGGP